MSGRLAGRIALVTGASRGIGAAVARRFALEGAHVVLLARTQGGLEEQDDAIRAEGGAATLVTLDLRQPDDIERFAAAFFERFGRLDVLVGNAGVLGVLSPLGHIAPDDWAEVMAVNLSANWHLIRYFDPLLRRSEAGRAIFVTTHIAADAPPFWGAYAASKAALESMVRAWAAEVGRITAIRANLIDPGPVRTRLRAQAFPGEVAVSLRAPDTVTDGFVDLAAADCQRNGDVLRLAE